MRHAGRSQDVLGDVVVDRTTRDCLDDEAEEREVDVLILPPLPRLERHRTTRGHVSGQEVRVGEDRVGMCEARGVEDGIPRWQARRV